MKKPSKYWWSKLSHKQKKEFKKNTNVDFLKMTIKLTFRQFISGGFIWEDTKEGHEYWDKISLKYYKR